LIQEGRITARYFGKRRLMDQRDIDAHIDKTFAEEQELPSWVVQASKRQRKKAAEQECKKAA
jgi:hypothetical protein